jgi:hypothetical protein
MLVKAKMAGFRGLSLKFLRALYTDFSVKIRTKFGLTEDIPVMRGLRQGCPASPLLFNIFINDIFVMAKGVQLGVSVPGVADLLVGLLFADDTTLFSRSCEELSLSLHCIHRWCRKNKMIINGNETYRSEVGVLYSITNRFPLVQSDDLP